MRLFFSCFHPSESGQRYPSKREEKSSLTFIALVTNLPCGGLLTVFTLQNSTDMGTHGHSWSQDAPTSIILRNEDTVCILMVGQNRFKERTVQTSQFRSFFSQIADGSKGITENRNSVSFQNSRDKIITNEREQAKLD